MSEIQAIREFIVENFLFGDGSRLQDNTSFLQDGIIDSTGILELTAFLEKTFGIKVEDHELVPQNMDSLAQVAAFVDRKRG
jgi:acyl carrier protein